MAVVQKLVQLRWLISKTLLTAYNWKTRWRHDFDANPMANIGFISFSGTSERFLVCQYASVRHIVYSRWKMGCTESGPCDRLKTHQPQTNATCWKGTSTHISYFRRNRVFEVFFGADFFFLLCLCHDVRWQKVRNLTLVLFEIWWNRLRNSV